MATKLTTESVKKRIGNMYNSEYELLSEYTLASNPITIKHKPCGYTYTVGRAKDFLNEGKCLCKQCNPPVRYSTVKHKLEENDIIERLKDPKYKDYSYIDGFVDSHTKLNMLHKECGNTFKVSPQMFFGVKQTRCSFCCNKNRGKYQVKINYLQSLLDEKSYGNEYEWLEDYKGDNKVKHLLLHKKCGNEFEFRPNDFQQGYICPFCTTSSSKEEIELYDFIKSNYKGKIMLHYRVQDNNKYYECDIYLPELKIGFEYNGVYWHSDKMLDKNYHINKKEVFNKKGISIFFINSYLWKDNKKEIIKSKILHLIKCNYNLEKVYARNTQIKFNISPKDKREFLNNNHIQGYCNDVFSVGLYYKDKLVSLMTFSDKRISLNNDNQRMELLRFANDINYRIIGSFSKLLKHSIEYIKENFSQYNEIYTFADYDLSQGNVYEKNNFEFVRLCKPSYFYIYKNKYYNRFSFRKSKLSTLFPEVYNEDSTEFEILDQVKNLYRIWNCGNLLYKYKL